LPVAERCHMPLVEDAACAIGSEMSFDRGKHWEPIGRPHGATACFSFHPRKVLTTGDGGMLTTSSPEVDRRFRLLRQHGMSVSDKVRHESNQIICEEYEVTGFNYRLTDLQAAVGIVQLARLPEFLQQRRTLASHYSEQLRNTPGITLPVEPEYAKTNWQSFQVNLDERSWQQPVMQRLLERNIASRAGVMCAHLQAPYRDTPCSNLPVSESLTQCGVILPLFPGMTEDEVDYVSRELHAVVSELAPASRKAA
jgi:perosamine synthetase